MSQQLITQEELTLTIEYLNYNGPISSDLPLEHDTERRQGFSKVVVYSAF